VGAYRAACLAALVASGCLDSPPDAGGPDGDDPTDCGSLLSLSDDFNGEPSEWTWAVDGLWTWDGSQILLNPEIDGLSMIFGRQSWSLDRGELVVHFDLAAMAEDSSLQLDLVGAQGEVTLTLESGTLRVDVVQDDFNGTRDSVPFDSRMDWWRIARRNGQFYWATSTDGEDWTEQGPFDAALSGLATITVFHYAGETASQVGVNAFNPGGASESACSVADLQDDFSARSPRWGIREEQFCDVRFDEAVDIGINEIETCGLVTLERFSLADSEVSVELEDPGDCLLAPIFQATFGSGQVAFICSLDEGEPMLHAYLQLDASDDELAVAPWSWEANRFLRFRHSTDEGGVAYETSPDGLEWTRFTTATGLSTDDLRSVEVALLVYAPELTANRIRFDHLNILPDAE
jgi:hypothetical protein